MNDRAVITGLGLITPLGRDVNQTWRALMAGEYIRDHARILSPLPEKRIFEIAARSALQAMKQAQWNSELTSDPSTALVVGTSKGPIETWLTAPPVGSSDKQLYPEFGLGELSASLARSIGH